MRHTYLMAGKEIINNYVLCKARIYISSFILINIFIIISYKP